MSFDLFSRDITSQNQATPSNTKGPSWLSLLGHSKDSLWSIDLFRCESLTLRSHWVLVVMDQWNRRIIGFCIHRGDVDVKEIESVPYVPMSDPFVQRVIGTIRREYLDHAPFSNSLDLARKLDDFKDYYNNHRTHAALSGQSPSRFGQPANQPTSQPVMREYQRL